MRSASCVRWVRGLVIIVLLALAGPLQLRAQPRTLPVVLDLKRISPVELRPGMEVAYDVRIRMGDAQLLWLSVFLKDFSGGNWVLGFSPEGVPARTEATVRASLRVEPYWLNGQYAVSQVSLRDSNNWTTTYLPNGKVSSSPSNVPDAPTSHSLNFEDAHFSIAGSVPVLVMPRLKSAVRTSPRIVAGDETVSFLLDIDPGTHGLINVDVEYLHENGLRFTAALPPDLDPSAPGVRHSMLPGLVRLERITAKTTTYRSVEYHRSGAIVYSPEVTASYGEASPHGLDFSALDFEVSTASSVKGGYSRLTNLSVLSTTVDPTRPLILGASVSAPLSGSLPVVIRGAGPSLAPFQVADPIADPELSTYDGVGRLLAICDDWLGNGQLTATSNHLGAFPFLSAASKDSALLRAQANGAFSAHLRNRALASGTGLIEIYDASDEETWKHSSRARLVNLSALTTVDANGTLIAGFIVKGTRPLKLLIRGVGPALGAFGVSGVMDDPQIQVYDSEGRQIASNDDWQRQSSGGVNPTDAIARSGAFLLPDGSKDAALLLEMSNGLASVHLSGANGSRGAALIEIYAIE